MKIAIEIRASLQTIKLSSSKTIRKHFDEIIIACGQYYEKQKARYFHLSIPKQITDFKEWV